MTEFVEGTVVICPTSQSGCIAQIDGSDCWVLLLNGDIWVGPTNRLILPQGPEHLASCPLNVPRVEQKIKLK